MKFEKRLMVVCMMIVAILLTGCLGSTGSGNNDPMVFSEDEVSQDQENEGFEFSDDEVAESNENEFNITEEDINEDDENDLEADPEPEAIEPGELDFGDPPTSEDIDKNFEIDPCLLGTWVVDNNSYLAILQDLAFVYGYDDSTFSGLEGTFTVTFNDDWSLKTDGDLVLEISSDEGSITSDIKQSADGLYAVLYGSMYFVGDSETTATFMGESNTAEGEITDADYTCNGDTLTIDRLTYYRTD